MSARDPELTRLLVLELERHLVTIEGGTDAEAVMRAVHALKGSAGLAGEQELAAALTRLERRMKSSDDTARREVVDVVRVAIQRLSAGESAMLAEWPYPPEGLVVQPLESSTRAQYVAEVADRLAQIDAALGSAGDPLESAASVYRQVHTLKGAGSAVGDEPMTWFCHGLEDRLRAANASRESALAALADVAHWRAVLGGLVEDPEGALRTLRVNYGRRPITGVPSVQPPSARFDEEPRSVVEEATVRVSTASVDRLIDRFVAFGVARERVAARSEEAREQSRAMRRVRGAGES